MKKPFIGDAGKASLLAAFLGWVVLGQMLQRVAAAAEKGIELEGLLVASFVIALTLTGVGGLVALLGLLRKLPDASRGRSIFALVINGVAALAACGMWLILTINAQPPSVAAVLGAGAMLPGLVPAATEDAVLDAAAGERVTNSKGRSLTVRWEGPIDAAMLSDRGTMLEALYGDTVKGEPESQDVGGHAGVRARLVLEGHRAALISWRCPVTRRAFTMLTMAPNQQEATAYLDDAVGLVACHGYGHVSYPEARWSPPEGWEDLGEEQGIQWYLGPNQTLGIAAMSMSNPVDFIEACPLAIGEGLEFELETLGNQITAPAQPLETGCGAVVGVHTPEGTQETARVELRLCDNIALHLFHHLGEGAEPHEPQGISCVVVAEG